MKIKASQANTPNWKNVYTHTNLPKPLRPLENLAKNIWWTWNNEALELFEAIDIDLWEECDHNAVAFLQKLSFEKATEAAQNADILAQAQKVIKDFSEYMDKKSDPSKTSVAYFSMEYGLASILKIYSGGLGVLAGDYLKEASDSQVDLTAVGFLYRYGYFTQGISPDGQQVANYEPQNFNALPLEAVLDENKQQLVLEVPYPERIVYANVWRANVGRVSLYLLDTDIDANSEFDRSITHQLYGGDWENRMKQEYLLGIGGILLLNKLGIKKEIYHCNEGHAAFINIQRLLDLIEGEGLSFSEALEVVRASGLYTVHTPVPAGHDYFDEGLVGKYLGSYPERLGISWQEFMDMGREHPGSDEKFSMSTFALNTCLAANGVSYLHGKVSQNMFAHIWNGYFPEELHVGYVTNGVHLPTWTAKEMKGLYNKHFDKKFLQDQSNPKIWDAIYNVPDEELWEVRTTLKKRLINYVKSQMKRNLSKGERKPSQVLSLINDIKPEALIVGFGRRFATYKRAHLLFTDLDRLSKLVNNPERPIQFLFTGKAHPADGGGQGLIKHIIEISQRPEFFGKIIFLENYDMRLAKRLISGVDVWLNTPTRPLEASGTSGEKAEMNGVLNFSVLDGWWYEGYKPQAGWMLTDKRTYTNQAYQDDLDASIIYNTFENEILPLYYNNKNEKGFSSEWVKWIKNSIAQIAPHYTTKRMIDDYIHRFYQPLQKRHQFVAENNYQKARELATWKINTANTWHELTVDSVEFPLTSDLKEQDILDLIEGETYTCRVVLDKKNIPSDIGVDLVFTEYDTKNNSDKFVSSDAFSLVKTEGSKLHFELNFQPKQNGALRAALRAYPVHKDMAHRQDFAYVYWF